RRPLHLRVRKLGREDKACSPCLHGFRRRDPSSTPERPVGYPIRRMIGRKMWAPRKAPPVPLRNRLNSLTPQVTPYRQRSPTGSGRLQSTASFSEQPPRIVEIPTRGQVAKLHLREPMLGAAWARAPRVWASSWGKRGG